MRTRSLLRVNLEGEIQEIMESLAKICGILDLRGSIRRNQEEGTKWRFVEVWWFAFDHFNGHDTQTPNIDLPAVLFPSDHFWRHPVWSADHRGSFGVSLIDLRTESEIGCQVVSS